MKYSVTRSLAAAAALCGVALVPLPADAAIDFSAAAGELAAKVSFAALGGNLLQVTLTNTSTYTAGVPAEVLTGVFFDLPGTLSTIGSSAYLAAGSTAINTAANTAPYVNQQPPGGNVGGEWAYVGGLSGAPGGATKGISSSGLGLFGGANLNGPNLQNPAALDGMQYGIVTASTTTADFNGGMDQNAFIRNAVVFTLSNYTGGSLGLASIGNVSFQYGTALSEPNIRPGGPPPVCENGQPNWPVCGPRDGVNVPEPASMALMGAGLAGLALARRRRRTG